MGYTMMCRRCPDHEFLEVVEGSRMQHTGAGIDGEAASRDAARRDAEHAPDPIGVDSPEAQNAMWERVVAHILDTVPAARAINLETSDQSYGYGFVITNVFGIGGVELLDEMQILVLSNDISGELGDLNWSERGGVLGEDYHGYAYMLL